MIGVSELILQSLELNMLIPTILVSIVSGGMTGTLQSSTSILQSRLLTNGGMKEGHEETRQHNLYNILPA